MVQKVHMETAQGNAHEVTPRTAQHQLYEILWGCFVNGHVHSIFNWPIEGCHSQTWELESWRIDKGELENRLSASWWTLRIRFLTQNEESSTLNSKVRVQLPFGEDFLSVHCSSKRLSWTLQLLTPSLHIGPHTSTTHVIFQGQMAQGAVSFRCDLRTKWRQTDWWTEWGKTCEPYWAWNFANSKQSWPVFWMEQVVFCKKIPQF